MSPNRRPSRDEGCCSVSFLKYVLFIFNFLFYLSGLAVLGVGIWTYFFKSSYVALLPTSTYLLTTYVLSGAGALVLLVGICGCVGVLKENRCCLLSFCFLLLLIFLLEAVSGVLAYVYSDQLEKELKGSLNETFAKKFDSDLKITEAANQLHTQFGCCGANSYQDWTKSKWYEKVNNASEIASRDGKILKAPPCCCKTFTSTTCGTSDHPSNINTEGCLEYLTEEIRNQEIILGAVGLGVSTVQLFGMVLSCCLYVKLKDFEEYNKARTAHSYY